MSERDINNLQNRISVQEKVIERLIIRSELSLHLLSMILPTSGLTSEALIYKIEQFKYSSPAVSMEALEIEKRKFIDII
ncbi:hypothetical protein [Serratia fonticola]|uniref:hypothetical protein n=1 Tax=Serratia fonticola TaxID=47917 RepID=UPI001C488CD0|nr:hypothetical protein [Serratia fonticola]QXN65213.1 hypothetical protein J8M99_25435 [Serratia fonticola]